MKVVGVIPARYKSSRFPGKPLADICGKPMIWWVYCQARKTKGLDAVYVATDDERIEQVCREYNLCCIMTRNDHNNGTERVYEVSQKIEADLYVVINGDEPLIDPKTIEKIIPEKMPEDDFFVCNLMTEVKSPVEAVDFTNIKVVVDSESNALFMSRSPIPYPKASVEYQYYKHVGVLIYNKNALKFFVSTPKGYNERIEDVNELRFIDHGKKLKMIKVEADTLSVDTSKDLEKVKDVIEKRLKSEKRKNE